MPKVTIALETFEIEQTIPFAFKIAVILGAP